MPQPPSRERTMLSPQPQQSLHVRVELRLVRATTFSGKRVVGIAWPTTWKITPVVRITTAGHADLIAVVQLGNPAKRQYQPERQFEFFRRTAICTCKPRDIMVTKKCYELFGVDIQGIAPQHIGKPAGRCVIQKHVSQREIHWIIENRRDT